MYDRGGESNLARNGKCKNNLVYNISSNDNKTYQKYGLSADGIYGDGGRDIMIRDNIVHHCDVGICFGVLGIRMGLLPTSK